MLEFAPACAISQAVLNTHARIMAFHQCRRSFSCISTLMQKNTLLHSSNAHDASMCIQHARLLSSMSLLMPHSAFLNASQSQIYIDGIEICRFMHRMQENALLHSSNACDAAFPAQACLCHAWHLWMPYLLRYMYGIDICRFMHPSLCPCHEHDTSGSIAAAVSTGMKNAHASRQGGRTRASMDPHWHRPSFYARCRVDISVGMALRNAKVGSMRENQSDPNFAWSAVEDVSWSSLRHLAMANFEIVEKLVKWKSG